MRGTLAFNHFLRLSTICVIPGHVHWWLGHTSVGNGFNIPSCSKARCSMSEYWVTSFKKNCVQNVPIIPRSYFLLLINIDRGGIRTLVRQKTKITKRPLIIALKKIKLARVLFKILISESCHGTTKDVECAPATTKTTTWRGQLFDFFRVPSGTAPIQLQFKLVP